jgi:hypothetical protein
MAGEKVTHTEIMLELKHTQITIDKIEKQLGILNGTVRSNTIAIAVMKATAGTISAIVALIIATAISLFSGKLK